MSERYGISQGVAVLIRRQNPETKKGEVLLALRAGHLRYMGGYWSLPVGHVDPIKGPKPGGPITESPSQAMAREIEEELGVKVSSKKLKALLTVHTPPEDGEGLEGQRTDTYFEVDETELEGELQNMEPDRCDEMRWFPEDELPKKFIPRQLMALGCIAAGETYTEIGW